MFDPARLDIYHNLLKSVAEEMGVALTRTSFSPNIKERRDFSCALFDGRGRMVVQGEHLPVHLGSMPLSVESVLSSMELGEGDTAIVNDPYRGGTHLPDITFVTPVFERRGGAGSPRGSTYGPVRGTARHARGAVRGLRSARRSARPVFFVASRAHHADVGGMSPGSMPVSREIYQEGIIVPPTLLVRGGVVNADVLNLLLANVRTPDERAGDIAAQLAANELGRRRLAGMLLSQGRRELTRASTALQEYAGKMMRGLIASLPRGTYRFHDFLDDDGVSARPLRIACELTLGRAGALVDFSGTSPQTAGCVNMYCCAGSAPATVEATSPFAIRKTGRMTAMQVAAAISRHGSL